MAGLAGRARGTVLSLRFSLPSLLLISCAVIGAVLYVIASRSQDQRVEQEFLATQLPRAADLQRRTERAAEHSAREAGQAEFDQIGAVEALRAAVLVAPDHRVLLANRREWVNRAVDFSAFGLAPADQAAVRDATTEARASQQLQTRFTIDRQGLVLIVPAAWPRSREARRVDRSALIMLVYDLSPTKAVAGLHLQRQFMQMAAGLLLAAVGLGLSLHFLVTRRLESVYDRMGRLAKGDPIVAAPSRLHDEVAEIREQFSAMASAVQREIADRQQAEAELRRVNRTVRTISHCNQALVHATDEDALLNEICRVIVEDGGFRFAWVGFLVGGRVRTDAIVAQYGDDEGYLRALASIVRVHHLEPTLTRAALTSGQPVVIRDYETAPDVALWREEALKRGYRSSVLLPLMADGQRFGVLTIYASGPDAFDDHELAMLGEMAADLSYGVQALRTRQRHGEAERELRESQSRLVLALEMAQLAPWEYDVATGDFLFNDAFFALLRTSAAAEGGYTMPAAVYVQKFLPPDEAAAVQREIGLILASRDPHYSRGIEHRFLRADGSSGIMQARFTVVHDATGHVVRTRGVNQDISDRRQRQEELRISEERFRTAMSHSPVGMAIVAIDGRFTEVNSALCRIIGYTREELIQTRFQALTHPDDLTRDLDLVQQLLDQQVEVYEIEKRYLHKRGYVVWTQVNVSLVRDEHQHPRYFVKQVQDITERKYAEAEMQALNERYERHQAAMAVLTRSHVQSPSQFPDVLRAVTEVVGRTLEVARVGVWRPNANLTSFVCHDLYEWPGDRHSAGMTIDSLAMADYARTLSQSDSIAASDAARDGRTAAFTAEHLTAFGVTSVIDVPIREQGALAGVLCCEHVGPRRQWTPDEQTFAVAVANLLSSLFAQVGRQHLEEQLRQAQKLEGIGQLAGGVAHDFNNVLTVILGKAGQLSDDPRLPADAREAADDIRQGGERAANLTRQLLAFSRRQAMQVRDVDLNVVIRSVSRMLERVLGEDLTLRFSFATEPALVCADAGMLDQVVLNLAINARDAMRQGGVLMVETSVVEINAATAAQAGHAPGPYACLRVSDTGSGIAPENLPNIFEPFFTTKDVGKGTGLGLATTYGIIKQHGGWIEVDSQVGLGTNFRVFLPRLPHLRPVDQVVTPALPALGTTGRESILVVEDEAGVRSLMIEALRGEGYQVLEAESGPHALDVWHRLGGTVDLLITDMVMPDGMNGLELASQLKTIKPALRIIYISGYLADVSQEELLRSEGATYLAKPFSLPALARVVRQSLDATDDRRSPRS